MEIKNEVMIVDERTLKDKIYVIRGQQVMLDFDLAEIYGYSTRRFNEQVQRNIEKFDSDFMFELTKEEIGFLVRSQFATSRNNTLFMGQSGGSRYLPHAFTEQGIYMLMTVLRGEIAIKQSKALIRLFKSMKDYIVSKMEYPPIDKFNEIAIKTYENSDAIDDIRRQMVTHNQLNTFIKIFDDKKQEELLILDGQPFKADVAYQRIYSKAKKNIILIDDYIGVKTLQHLAIAKNNVDINIITDNKASKPLTLNEHNDLIKEYPSMNIRFIESNKKAHDRYIILDYGNKDMKVYLCGSSSKDTGNKISTIIKINRTLEYKPMIKELLSNNTLKLK